MMHTKSGYLKYRLESGKFSAHVAPKKGQRGFRDAWGCFGGEIVGISVPFVVKSVSCWSTLSAMPFRLCNTLIPSVTLYSSKIILQGVLHRLLLHGLSSATFRSINTLPIRRTSIQSNMSVYSSSNSFSNSIQIPLTPPAVPILQEPDW